MPETKTLSSLEEFVGHAKTLIAECNQALATIQMHPVINQHQKEFNRTPQLFDALKTRLSVVTTCYTALEEITQQYIPPEFNPPAALTQQLEERIAARQTLQSQLDAKEKERETKIATLNQEIKNLSDDLEQKRSALRSENAEKQADYDTKISSFKPRLEDLDSQIAQHQGCCSCLSFELKDLKRRKQALLDEIDKIPRPVYADKIENEDVIVSQISSKQREVLELIKQKESQEIQNANLTLIKLGQRIGRFEGLIKSSKEKTKNAIPNEIMFQCVRLYENIVLLNLTLTQAVHYVEPIQKINEPNSPIGQFLKSIKEKLETIWKKLISLFTLHNEDHKGNHFHRKFLELPKKAALSEVDLQKGVLTQEDILSPAAPTQELIERFIPTKDGQTLSEKGEYISGARAVTPTTTHEPAAAAAPRMAA